MGCGASRGGNAVVAPAPTARTEAHAGKDTPAPAEAEVPFERPNAASAGPALCEDRRVSRLSPLPSRVDGPSLRSLFASLDESSCGLVDKERVQAWINSQDSVQNHFLGRELNKWCTGNERLTFAEFKALVHRAQRLTLERFVLSLDLHKLIAEAVPLDDDLDPLQKLASLSQAPDEQLSQLLEPTRVARSIRAGLAQTHDAREQRLRQTARSALGVDEDAEEKLQGLQLEYSKLLRKQLRALEHSSGKTFLKPVCTEKLTADEDWVVGGLTGLMDVDQFVKLKLDLWEAAGGGGGRPGPPDDAARKPKLVMTDPSTWTWANLNTIPPDDIGVLANMQRFAGKHYVREVVCVCVCVCVCVHACMHACMHT